MGHHIDAKGRFQSDKYPDLPPDKIVLSFHDPIAQVVLAKYAASTTDRELAKDIASRLRSIRAVQEREELSNLADGDRCERENDRPLMQSRKKRERG